MVRNSYFWALAQLQGQASHRDWEYESEVWLALSRMLLSFSESGYLGLKNILGFPIMREIPDVLLRPVSTWQ